MAGIIEEIEKEVVKIMEGKPSDDSKLYESNEFFYENVDKKIEWENNGFSCHITKLALRTLLEMAYLEGKKNGLIKAQEECANKYVKSTEAKDHQYMYTCKNCGRGFDTNVILTSNPPQVTCPHCNKNMFI